MNKYNPTNAQLLQEITKRLDANQIGFWIENQDCYLWENTYHYTNKIKVGDLSLTQENYYIKLTKECFKMTKGQEEKQKFLTTKFQAISDVELIEELKKRTQNQTIKMSMYPNHQHIFIEGKDIKCNSSNCFPIEIKETKSSTETKKT